MENIYECDSKKESRYRYSGRNIVDVYYSITSKRAGAHKRAVLVMSIFYDNMRILDYTITLPTKLPLKISKMEEPMANTIVNAARNIIESNIVDSLPDIYALDKLNIIFCCNCTKTVICSRDIVLLHLKNMRGRIQYHLSSCCNGYEPVRIEDKIKLPFICFGSGNMSSMKNIARSIAEGVR